MRNPRTTSKTYLLTLRALHTDVSVSIRSREETNNIAGLETEISNTDSWWVQVMRDDNQPHLGTLLSLD